MKWQSRDIRRIARDTLNAESRRYWTSPMLHIRSIRENTTDSVG